MSLLVAIGFILNMIGWWFNVHHDKRCWPIWVASAVFLQLDAGLTRQWMLLVHFTSYQVINIWGWRKWGGYRKAADTNVQSPKSP